MKLVIVNFRKILRKNLIKDLMTGVENRLVRIWKRLLNKKDNRENLKKAYLRIINNQKVQHLIKLLNHR
uniref:Uncharacterized protein n=1 Tax=Dulem virus 42 TaxID=3145760 RepID=A0AAU8B9H1_9CAUD